MSIKGGSSKKDPVSWEMPRLGPSVVELGVKLVLGVLYIVSRESVNSSTDERESDSIVVAKLG